MEENKKQISAKKATIITLLRVECFVSFSHSHTLSKWIKVVVGFFAYFLSLFLLETSQIIYQSSIQMFMSKWKE